MEENIELIDNEKNEAITLKDSSINRLNLSFNKHIEAKQYKSNNKLAYWIHTFAKYHDAEKSFDYSTIKTFKRGDVIKANLGFNIGNELGGLHYCLVLSKNDNHSFGTLNIVPLTSIKENKGYPKYSVDIENELHQLLIAKFETIYDKFQPDIENTLQSIKNNPENNSKELTDLTSKVKYLAKIKDEIKNMKSGSIVLVNQITTISKMRIYDPINSNGVLFGIRLSNKTLNTVDEAIKKMLTK